jgi:glycosyltransferase involved in cell wall biosynthesis
MRDTLRARVAELGLDDRVTLTGRVPHAEIVRYYSLLDVVANPRTDDRVSRLVSPTKPLEALATARTLVVSRTPAMLELVDEGRTALAVDPDSVEDLAEVLDRLVGDPDLRRRLGTAARESVIARRSWAANGQRYRELFAKLGAASP